MQACGPGRRQTKKNKQAAVTHPLRGAMSKCTHEADSRVIMLDSWLWAALMWAGVLMGSYHRYHTIVSVPWTGPIATAAT